MSAKTKALGRGLGAIFELDNVTPPEKKSVSTTTEIALKKIIPNPNQPRKNFDENTLEELADSIRALGVIQPITVRKESEEEYIIISGERRWRASLLAELETVPAYVREANDQDLHEMALVENIQRQDLNSMEVAMSLQRLMDEFNLTQDMLSTRVGKKRSTIANYIRLLSLPVEVQSAVREEYITMGHAKAIAGAPEERQLQVLKNCIKKSLSVRQVEEMVKKMNAKIATPEKEKELEQDYPESYGDLVVYLEPFFSHRIAIKRDKKGTGGEIIISFEGDKEIENFVANFKKVSKK